MISGPEFLAMLFGLFVGLLFSGGKRFTHTDWQQAVRQSDAQRLCRALSDTNICKKLAEKLEIQADGGDDPAEFVEWAIREVWQSVDGGNIYKPKPVVKG